MKIAQLHNGVEMHFPDHVPDDHMDAAVMQYHAGQQSAPPSAEIPSTPPLDLGHFMPMIMMALKDYVDKQQADQQSEVAAMEDENSFRKVDAQLRLEESRQKVKAIGEVAAALAALPKYLESLNKIADQSEKIDVLVKSVSALSSTIDRTGREIIKTLLLPRELNFDNKGVPKGIQAKQKV